ncbi:hypothetical protein [Xanthomonas campestris]|uniref:hypothetical protein n=1 Tax=Xanthomonas campestris TaxID=339 RepID=UPI001CC0E2B4|nr:hypothetical protein [Xanthomonas campestris]UAU33963.1 hypothetical protein JH290_17450 [Xanthomonas campestris pv. incanae]
MRLMRALPLSLLLLPLLAGAQSGWIDTQGQPIPNSSSRKAVQDLGASLLLTPDANWQQKWNTPSDTTPHFNEVDHLATGEVLFMLILLSNPCLDAQRHTDVVCNIRIIDPTGHLVQDTTDTPCLQGELSGDPRNVYMAQASLHVEAEADDPPGRWQVQVTVNDRQRGVSIPLSTSFTMGRKRAAATAR